MELKIFFWSSVDPLLLPMYEQNKQKNRPSLKQINVFRKNVLVSNGPTVFTALFKLQHFDALVPNNAFLFHLPNQGKESNSKPGPAPVT